jgi:hypothetical protein
MANIHKKYPGKSAAEIFEKVDATMARMAEKHSLDYERGADGRTGKVSKMGINGKYEVKDGEVTVDLKFPMLVPGPMKRTVEEAIEKRLESLFA